MKSLLSIIKQSLPYNIISRSFVQDAGDNSNYLLETITGKTSMVIFQPRVKAIYISNNTLPFPNINEQRLLQQKIQNILS